MRAIGRIAVGREPDVGEAQSRFLHNVETARPERQRELAETTRTASVPGDEGSTTRAAAIRDAAIEEAPKHRRLIRSAKGGRILSAIMLPFLATWAPPGFAVLTTTGRKSGKRRRKCIRAIRRGEKVYIVQLRPPVIAIERPTALTSWVWNIRANQRVKLRIGFCTYAGTAREIDDPAELELAREAMCETIHAIDYDECALHVRGFPTREKVKALHRYWFETGVPVVVELTA